MKDIFEILKDENKLIKEIKKEGFDILKKYNLMEKYIEKDYQGFIKTIVFEIKNNPLNRDWDWNGTIGLLFSYKEGSISCQIQLEARTKYVNDSYYYKYENWLNDDGCYYEITDPIELLDYEDFKDYYEYEYCYNFSKFDDLKNYNNIEILKSLVEYIVDYDELLNTCVKAEKDIIDFENYYYNQWIEIALEERYCKDIEDITEEEKYLYEEEIAGLDTYNMMVREGWIDED